MDAKGHRPSRNAGGLPHPQWNNQAPPTVEGETGETPDRPTRLHAIHERVRSGGYSVPAGAIAHRMVERMMATDRDRSS